MAAVATAPAPRLSAARARRWLRDNLFSSRWNAVLTVVTLVAVVWLTFSLLRFVFVSADWTVIEANRRLIFLGRYPQGEEWRVWAALWFVAALGGLSTGLWGRVTVRDLVVFLLALIFLYGFLLEGTPALLFGVAVALLAAGVVLGDRPRNTRFEGRAKQAVALGWVLAIPFAVLILTAFGGVEANNWSGLLLNVMIAAIAIVASIPIGIVLALGRASRLRAISVVCTFVIETVRGAPLIAWLFVAWFVLPAFLPPILGFDDISLVNRAILMFSVFTGAYVAEIVRGGLQSLGRGQYEAARALGMGAFSMYAYIILPQALRAVIPAMVSQFISLWKDTTLVSILAMTDALGAAEATLAQREFFGRQREVLLFAAFLFWVVAFGMSRLSQRLERNLGVGVR